MVCVKISISAQGYDDMFESGNFKRRKRMRRHTYKPGLYKAWLGESQAFQSLYRSYPSSLYMTGAPWSSLPSVKTEIGGYGYGATPSATPTPCSPPCHTFPPSPPPLAHTITSMLEWHSLPMRAPLGPPFLHFQTQNLGVLMKQVSH